MLRSRKTKVFQRVPRKEDGNTSSSSVISKVVPLEKKVNPAKHWCFTWNNPTIDDWNLVCSKSSKVDGLVAQSEIGESGTQHIQGYLRFVSKGRPFSLGWGKEVHWEVTRNVKESINYCRKTDSYDSERGWSIEYGVTKKVKDPMEDLVPYDWQQEIIDLVKTEPDKRTIHWYWEPRGGKGKSVLMFHLALKYNALVVGGKADDMKCAIAAYQKDDKPMPEVICMDVPRVVGANVSYAGIESVKNGCFFSGKYESGMVMMNSPHVIVFANEAPYMEKMSVDRWHIVNIAPEECAGLAMEPEGIPQPSLTG